MLLSIQGKKSQKILFCKLFYNTLRPDKWHKMNLYFDPNFIDVWSSGFNCQYVSIASGNDLAQNGWHAIPWINKNNETRITLTSKYPRLPRSIYVQHVEVVKLLGPWNSLVTWAHAEDGDRETVRPMKQSRYPPPVNQGILHLWSKFANPSLKWVASYSADNLKIG